MDPITWRTSHFVEASSKFLCVGPGTTNKSFSQSQIIPNTLPVKVGARSFSPKELTNFLEFEPHSLRFIEALENRVLDSVYRLLASCRFLTPVIKLST